MATEPDRKRSVVKTSRIKAARYAEILRSSCRARGELFIVSALKNGDAETRLGLAIGKKIVALAVNRNYFKRQIRTVYRPVAARLRGFDVVVRLRRAYPKSAARRARNELARHFAAIEQCRDL